MRPLLTVLLTALVLLRPTHAPAVTHATLDNGMDVVVIEDRRAPVVVHMVWYRAGAADEPPGKSGVAHFLEHLMFKGTESRAPGEFSDIVTANGGRDNAFTSWDYTGYFQRVAADRLALMMQLEADRMANLSVPKDEWRPERDVVLNERGQQQESRVGRQFNAAMLAALFRAHPYNTPIIGWRHEVENLTLSDAMAFYDAHYTPSNAILVVAGDVTAEDALAMARTHYGALPADPDAGMALRPMEPPHLAPRRLTFTDDRVGTPYLTRMHVAPTRHATQDAAALQMLAALLGGSQTTSVLARKLTYEQDIALATWAGYSGMARDYGRFTLGVAPVAGVSLQKAEAALDEAIAAFLRDGIDRAQFDRVRRQIRASEIYNRDSLQRRARQYGAGLAVGLSAKDVDGWVDALDAVTQQQVLDAARQVLQDRDASVTGYLTRPDQQQATN